MRLGFLTIFAAYCTAKLINDNFDKKSVINEIDNVLIDIVSTHHRNMKRSTIILYGSPSNYLFNKLTSLNMDLVVMNKNYKNRTGFIFSPPGDPTENYIQHPAGLIIFYTKKPEEIPEGLIDCITTVYWTTEAKFLVYSEENFPLPDMFYIFWWHNLPLINIIHYENTVKISGFNPYNKINPERHQYGCFSTLGADEMFEGNMSPYIRCNESCTGLDLNTYSDTMFVQSCMEINTEDYTNEAVIFNDFTRNLNGYTLSVSVIDLPPLLVVDHSEVGIKKLKGKDGFMMQVLAEKINFTISYKNREKKKNENFQTFITGMMDLAFRRCDLACNTIYMIPISYPPLSLCYPIEGSGLCFVVHRADVIPTWVNFASIFDRSSLILVLVVFQATVFLYYYYLRKLRKISIVDSIESGYLYTIQLFLSLPINWVGRNSSLRTFVFLIFWFIFVINFIFQGLVVSLLTIPRTEPDINTFEELYATGYNIEGYPSPDVMLPPTSDLYKGLNKKFVVNEQMYGCTNDVGRRSKKACWLDCLIAKGASKMLRDKDGNRFMHIGRDRVHSHFLTYFVPKDSPLKKRVEHYVKKVSENGLMNKWRDSSLIDPIESNVNIKTLHLEDLQGCFYLLWFGYILAGSVFVVEFSFVYIVKPAYRLMKKIFIYARKKLCGWKIVRKEYGE